jgi:flagellar motor switch protein FliG
LARILKSESPRILVLVLQTLPSDHAAAVLKLLPPEGRAAAISMMAAGLNVAEPISDCVLRTVFEQCALAGPINEVAADEDVQVKRLVGILQVVDREERLRLMGLLSEENEAVAAKIDDCLYDYTDLLRIGDRSLQKILTQTDQKTLAMALKTAPEAIREKVMKNMSERVRAALAEEMEFLSEVPNAKAEAARKDITAIIRTQDKEGTLVWLES